VCEKEERGVSLLYRCERHTQRERERERENSDIYIGNICIYIYIYYPHFLEIVYTLDVCILIGWI
jgi:hypothetical protein